MEDARQVHVPPVYDAAQTASGYSNVTGLVSGFALTAVVLVFTFAATATLSPAQKVDIGFATTLFALGFLGCLLGAFAFASLSGAPHSPAILTNSMLVASVVAVCLVAVLGGFEALSRAFLPAASSVFVTVCAVAACLSPIFVWFPQYDMVIDFAPPELPGAPQSTSDAWRLVAGLFLAGTAMAVIGLVINLVGALGHPHQWEYLALAFSGLLYTGFVFVYALLCARTPEQRLTVGRTWMLGLIQASFMLFLIALLP
jgi:hypothetical protein